MIHLEQGVSVYNGLNSSQPAHTVPVKEVYDWFEGKPSQLPPLPDATALQARMLELGTKDFPEYKPFKKAAPNCLFSFVGGYSRNTNEAKPYNHSAIHSRLINFDCDNELLELAQFLHAFGLISKGLLDFIDFAARSLSSPLSGAFWLNALVEIPTSFKDLPYGIAKHLNRDVWVKDLHKLYYLAVKYLLTEALGFDIIGGASHDITRVRTAVKDPNAYRNTNTTALSLSTLLELLESGKVKPFKAAKSLTVGTINKAFAVNDVQEQKALSIAVSQLQSRPNPCLWIDGNHHNFQFELSVILNRLGVPQDSATRLILANYPRRSYGGLGNAVTSAYAKTEFHGIENYLLEDCAPAYTFTLSKGETISNFAKEISAILESDRDVIMKAPTGTGKSYAVTNAIADHFVKRGAICVFVYPTNLLATQQAGANMPLITGESLKDLESFEINGIEAQILKCGKVSVNQNMFPVLVSVLKGLGLEIVCFIDECDTLISGCFKHISEPERLIMLDVQKALDLCDYKLLYSATPYLFDHYTKPKYTFIDIQQESRPAINLVTYKCDWRSKSDIIKNIIQFIDNNTKPNNILLIRLNNKDLIDDVYISLMALFASEQVIKVYSSDVVRETEDFQRLAHGLATNNSFFDSVRIVLCTGLIDCGLSIYECEREIISAYFEPQELDTVALIQFSDRHRTSKDKAIHYFYRGCTLQSQISTLQSEIEALQATINDLEGKDSIVLNMKLIGLNNKLLDKQEILSRYQTNYNVNGIYKAKLSRALKVANDLSFKAFKDYDYSDDNDGLMKYDYHTKRFTVCRFSIAYNVVCMVKKYNTIEKLLQSLPSYFKVSTGANIEVSEQNANLATAGQMIGNENIAEAESLTLNALFTINGKDVQSNSTASQFIAYISRKKPSKKLKVYSSNVVLHLDQIKALADQYKALDNRLDLVKGICEKYTVVSPYPIERKTVKSLVLQNDKTFSLSSERLYNYFNILCKEKHSPINTVKAYYLKTIALFLDKCLENNVTFTLSELSDYIGQQIRDKARLSRKVKVYQGKELMQLVKTVYVVEKAGRYDLKPVRVIELDNIKDLI